MAPLLYFLLIGASYALPTADDFLGDLPMENPDLFGGDMLGVERGEEDRNAIVNKAMLWPGGVVPYIKDPGLTAQIVIPIVFEKALEQFHKFTCVRFVPRTDQQDYIRIFPGQGCYSNVGRTGGQQPLSLGFGCGWVGTIRHELTHALGFYHEQNRSDRDDWLIILWENIKKGMEDQFVKLKPHQNDLLTQFDYGSLMLYGSYTFSKDRKNKLMTMVGKNNEFLQDVVIKYDFSKSDLKRINLLYNCTEYLNKE